MAKKRTKKTANTLVPSTDACLDILIAKIGQAEARLEAAKAQCDEAKAALDEALAEDTKGDKAYSKDARIAAQIYIEANRDRLTPKGLKTINRPSGIIEYRNGKLSVTVATKSQENIIQALEDQGLHGFITVKKTVNKEAVLSHIRINGVDSFPYVVGLGLKRGAETIEIIPNKTDSES